MKRCAHIYMTTLLSLLLLACYEPPHVDMLWNSEFSSAHEIACKYDSIKELLRKSDAERNTLNLCHYIWNSGEYMFKCRGKNEDISLLPQRIEELELDNSTVEAFMTARDTARFVDHYFTLKAMKRGDSFEESRDGLTITVFYPIRGINHNDYAKLEEVFTCKNTPLHIAYIKKLKFPFRNSGCNNELLKIRPLIEQNVEDCSLKQEIMELYQLYDNIIAGKQAPTPPLKDCNGKEHTFAEFKGKVLVIDVWATWCSSCIKKMPDFMALRESYIENPDIEFITVSTDRKEARNAWVKIIEKKGMGGMMNLFPDCSYESLFESEYHISGVPRYIVIDKYGNIVTAFAPPPGEGLEDCIKDALAK